MKIYAEELFLYNFIIDFSALYCTAIIWNARGRPVLCAAAANIIYIAYTAFWGLHPAIGLFLQVLAVLFGSKPQNIRQFIGMSVTVMLLNFFAGCLTMGLMAVFDMSPLIAALPCALLIFTVKRADKSVRLSKISGIYRIKLEKDGVFADLDALADTGNRLEINGRPVIAADKAALLPLYTSADTFTANCAAVSGEGEILCFYADMHINGKTVKNICAAVSNVPINGAYNAVIDPQLLL